MDLRVSPSGSPACACRAEQSLVLEVVFQGLRQWKSLDVMDAFPTQSESGYSSAQIHEGERLRCKGENKREKKLGSNRAAAASRLRIRFSPTEAQIPARLHNASSSPLYNEHWNHAEIFSSQRSSQQPA